MLSTCLMLNYNVFQGLVVHEKVGWAPLSGPFFQG